MQPSPIVEPAKTIAPVDTTVRAPMRVAGSGSRFAVDFGPSAGCLPTTAFSSTRTPSPSTVPGNTVAVGWTSAGIERSSEPIERTHDAGAVLRHHPPLALASDQPQGL